MNSVQDNNCSSMPNWPAMNPCSTFLESEFLLRDGGHLNLNNSGVAGSTDLNQGGDLLCDSGGEGGDGWTTGMTNPCSPLIESDFVEHGTDLDGVDFKAVSSYASNTSLADCLSEDEEEELIDTTTQQQHPQFLPHENSLILQILPQKYHQEYNNALTSSNNSNINTSINSSSSFPDVGFEETPPSNSFSLLPPPLTSQHSQANSYAMSSVPTTTITTATATTAAFSHHQMQMQTSPHNQQLPLPHHQYTNRSRATTTESSVMAVISASSTTANYFYKSGNTNSTSRPSTATTIGTTNGAVCGNNDALLLHRSNNGHGGMETMARNLDVWHTTNNGNDNDDDDGIMPSWETMGDANDDAEVLPMEHPQSSSNHQHSSSSKRHAPMKEVYPIPTLYNSSPRRRDDDCTSDVSSLSDDERYSLHDTNGGNNASDEKRRGVKKIQPNRTDHSPSERENGEGANTSSGIGGVVGVVGAAGAAATTAGGGVRAMAALLKKPRALANKMGGGAIITRESSTARDTVTTTATSASVGCHTLETINTPNSLLAHHTMQQSPMREEEFMARWRKEGQIKSGGERGGGTHRRTSSDGGNSIEEPFVSQHGYHRRCKTGTSGINSLRGYYRRIATTNTSNGASAVNNSWLLQSPGIPFSPGSRPPIIPSPGSQMQWKQQDEDLIDMNDDSSTLDPYAHLEPRGHKIVYQPTPIRLTPPSPSSPSLSPKMSSDDFRGIPLPICLNVCENSVISGTSSTGLTLKSGDVYLPNTGTMSTSSISYGTGEGRCMVRVSSGNNLLRRPPIQTRAKTISNVFDPLSEVNSYVGNLSVESASSVPPRYLKDDPLLSKSRYRSRLIPSSSLRKQVKSNRKLHQKPLGGVIEQESACMISAIASYETGPLSPMASGGAPRGSFTTGGDCSLSQATLDSLNSPLETEMTPKSFPQVSKSNNDDDDGSCESFAEEFQRRVKHSAVKEEIKHFIGKLNPKPVVKVGRKLLGRDTPPSNSLKRADGCLT